MRVRMADVAKKAGVSASTVCRALGANPQIPQATRDRVRAVAAEMGYQVDPLLSAFASRRRGRVAGSEATTIAYITKFEAAFTWQKNPFYSRLFEGATARADQMGYRLEHFWLKQTGMDGRKLSRILYNRGISVIVVPPTPGVRGHLSMDWSRFSSVAIGYSLLRPNLHRASTHHFHGILTVVRQLRRMGYRKIGFCVYKDTSKRVDGQWLAGFLLCQQLLEDIRLAYFVFDDRNASRISTWCQSEGLEVVIGGEPSVLEALRNGGMFPGAIDYVAGSWDGTEPEIAGLDQRPEEIGAVAVDLVVAQMQRGERGVPAVPFTTMVEPQWRDGQSLRRKPVSA